MTDILRLVVDREISSPFIGLILTPTSQVVFLKTRRVMPRHPIHLSEAPAATPMTDRRI